MAQTKKWTDERMRAAIREVQEALGVDRMPTEKECIKYFGGYALTKAVQRRGLTWTEYAEKIGLKTFYHQRMLDGYSRETASEMLKKHGFAVEAMPAKCRYDLLVSGCVRVRAKAGRVKRTRHGTRCWGFHPDRHKSECDLYILLAVGEDEKVKNTFVVPCSVSQYRSSITIQDGVGKYQKYSQWWEIIKALAERRKARNDNQLKAKGQQI